MNLRHPLLLQVLKMLLFQIHSVSKKAYFLQTLLADSFKTLNFPKGDYSYLVQFINDIL